MDIRDVFRALRKSWLIVLALALVGLLAGAAFAATQPRSYVASTRLFVAVQPTAQNNALEIGQGSNAAQQKARSYIDVITSAKVLDPVITQLGLSTNPVALAHRIAVGVQANAVVMQISVTGSDARETAVLANAIGASFANVVSNDLEKPVDGQSIVSIDTIDPARTPGVSSNAGTKTVALAGLAAGLLLGMALAFLRTMLDLRIHGAHDIEAITDRPIVGTISFDPTASVSPLIIQTSPRSPRAEAFRAFRTNLQFLDVDNSAKTMVMTSSMPSEGKSTTAANLAIALAETGARVALVDSDLRKPRLAEIMGLDNSVGLTDALIGSAELEDALQPWGTGHLSVLPAGRTPPNPSELLGSLGMQTVVSTLTQTHDFVIFDAPPLLPVTDAAVLSKLTDGVILVGAAGKTKKNQFGWAVEALHNIDSRILGVAITMLPTKGPDAYGYGNYSSYYGDDDPTAAEVPQRRTTFRKARA